MFTNNIVHTTSYQTANALPCFVWGGAIFLLLRYGVGGKARKVKKVYVGVGGKARLVYTSYVAVKGITVSWTPTNLGIGGKKTITFTALPYPSNATNLKLTWTKRDQYVTLTPSSDGMTCVCTASYAGESYASTITVSSADGPSVTLALTHSFGYIMSITKK